MFSHKKFLIVEGDNDDTKLLGIFHDKLFDNSNEPIDTIPKTFIEGWGGWQRVIGSNKVFKDTNLNIKTYCILDSDYHVKEDKELRYKEATKHGINLHIWERKEIENYILDSNAIYRVIKQDSPEAEISPEIIKAKIDELANSFKELVTDNFATEISDKDKSLAIKTVNSIARQIIDESWNDRKLWLIPGKKMIKTLSKWSQDEYKVSLNPFKICRQIQRNDIETEIKEILIKLEKNEEFTHLNK
jgi:hypothetical protein